MNLVKRLFVFALVAAVLLMGNAPVRAEGSYGAGSLLALEGVEGATVYYVGADGMKYPFPDQKTFNTWYPNFDDVVRVDLAELDMYDDGGTVTYRPGTKLVTHANTAKIYAVGPGGELYYIASAEDAEALYGSTWYTLVQDVIPGYFSSSYTVGSDLGDMYPTGTLLQVGDTIYYVDGEDVRPFADADAFEANNFSYDNVMEVDDVDSYGTGESVTGEETDLSGFMPGENMGSTTPVAAGDLSVSLAATTPAANVAYKSATHVPFTKVKLTAGDEDVTVDTLVVERMGVPASDNTFTGVNVMLEDNSLLASSYKSLNSDHQATFTQDVVVPANSSVYLLLVGKMSAFAATYQGEVPVLALASVVTDADVSGSFPIAGNGMTTNASITIGTLTVSENPDLGTLTEEVGTEDVEFLNVKLANDSSSADLRIDSIRFNNAGSADDADVENLELVVDGNVIATSEMDNNYVMFDLGECGDTCTIADGKNETFQLRGDIVGGSGRTLDFDVKKADDIMGYDLLNSTYVTPSSAIDSGRTITISRGTLNVSKTNTVEAGNVAEDTNDLAFGTWNFKVAGEPITISTIKFDVDVTGTVSSSDFTNLKLVDSDGSALTGATDAADDSTSSKDGSVTFSDSFTLPIGDNELKLVGNLSADAANADTVQFAVDFSSTATTNLDATGDTTGDAIVIAAHAFPNAEVDANLITVTDLALTVTTGATPPAMTIAGGTSRQLYTNVSFDALDSSEDVKVTAFEFYITASATAKTNELQNITFVVDGTELDITKDGTKATVDTDEEISVSLSGDDQFVIPKETSVNMEIYADLSAGATAGGTHKIDITSTNSNVVTAQGATSGNSIDAAEGTATSNAMTVGTAGGTVEVSLDAGTPNAALFAGGTEVELAKFKFYASTTEDVELDYIYLTQVVTDTNSSSYLDYDNIWFVDEEGNAVTDVNFTPTSTFPKVNFPDDAFIVDHEDNNGAVLTLMADLATVSNYQAYSDHAVGYKINAAGDVVAKGALTGSGSNEYLSTGAAPTGKTHYMFKGYPVFSRVNLTSSLTNGENDLFKFEVTAVNNDIALYGFTFDLATTGVDVTNLNIFEVDGSTETQLNGTAGTPTGNTYVWQTVGTDWTSNYSGSEVVVSSGGTATFVLRGNVTGAASGDSVSVKMAGDSAHVAGTDSLLHTADEVDSDTHDDFIWTDYSAGAHTTSTDDWTNGFLVSGLPSSSSSAQVLSL